MVKTWPCPERSKAFAVFRCSERVFRVIQAPILHAAISFTI